MPLSSGSVLSGGSVLGTFDKIITGIVYERTLSDNAGVADQQQAYEEKLRSLLSSLSVNDSIIRTLQLAGAAIERTLSSNIDINDLVNRDTLLVRTLTSEVNLTDAIQSIKGIILDRVLTSNITLYDFVSTEKEITRLLSDVIVLADAVLQDKNLVRLLQSNIDLVDVIARTITLTPQTYNRILSDAVALQDLILKETTGQLIKLILTALTNVYTIDTDVEEYNIIQDLETKNIDIGTGDV